MENTRAIIDLDINTSEAAAHLRTLQAQISAFQSSLSKTSSVQADAAKNYARQLTELVDASRFFTAETVKMQTAATALDKTLSKGQVTMGQFLGAKFQRNGTAAAQVMSLANARAAALQTQFIATGAAANGMRDAIAIRPLQAFNKESVVAAEKLAIQRAMLNQATTSMINFGKNTQWAGRQLMVGFTVPLTMFAAAAGKTFMDLEKQAIAFKKVYGDAFTTPEELNRNIAAVKSLSAEMTKYGIAVSDTMDLAAQAAASGAKNADLISATTEATRLSVLGQLDQQEALKTTIALQSAFGISGEKLTKTINFMNMVENQTVLTLQDMVAAIPRVAPVIEGLGGSVEDLAIMLTAMREGGVTAEQGANALKSGLASLINPTDRAVEKLQDLGISLNTIVSANRGDLMGVVKDFGRALSTLDEFSRQQALEQVFGKFQYARMGALFSNIVRDGSQASRAMDAAAMSATSLAATAEKELGVIAESPAIKFTAAMEKLKLAIAPIGEMFVKMATPILNFLTSIVDKFNNLPDFAKNFIGLATVVTGLVIPAGTMFLGLLMNLIGTLVKFGSMIGIAFKGFVSGGISGAFKAVSQSMKYMSLAEIDAATAAQQLAGTTTAVNEALLGQVGAADGATAGILELAYAYEILNQQMNEAAAASPLAFGAPAAAGRAAARGPRTRRAFGGTIPGSGNTDKVPAMLTPGEFVVNKAATQKNLPLLKAINGGYIKAFAEGDEVAQAMQARLAARQGMPTQASNAAQGLKTRASSMHRTHFGASKNISTIAELDAIFGKDNTSTKVAIARALISGGIPVDALSNDWILFPATINEAAKRNTRAPMPISKVIKELEANRSKVKFAYGKRVSAFASLNPKVSSDEFVSNMIAGLKDYQRRNGDVNITDDLLTSIRNDKYPNMVGAGVTTGMRLPTKGDLATLAGTTPDSRDFETRTNALLRQRRIPISVGQVAAKDPYWALHLLESIGGALKFGGRGGRTFAIKQKFAASTGYATGGPVVPGSGNKDTVPAMLTPGEFVINKDATKKNLALLHAINGGKIMGYARGGEVIGYDYVGKPITDPDFAKHTVRNGGAIYDENGNRMDDKAVGRSIARAIAIRRSRPSMGRRAAGGYSKAVSGGMSRLAGMGAKGAGIGMGMSMAGGAIAMSSGMFAESNPGLANAMSIGGTAMSMAGMLPMLAPMLGPLAAIAPVAIPVVAALGAAGIALKVWRTSVDDAAKQAAEFGSNVGGTANALNNMAAILGQATPAQERTKLQMGITPEQSQVVNEFAATLEQGAGKQFIEDLKAATDAERFKKLSDYLKNAVASGMLDKDQAKAFAQAVGMQLGDAVLANKAISSIAGQGTGTAAVKELADMRKSAVDADGSLRDLANSSGEASLANDAAGRAIGAAVQVIQDYGNVVAMAQQDYAEGKITWDEYYAAVTDAKNAQQEYTRVITKSVQNATEQGAARQALDQQLVATGLTQEVVDAITHATDIGISNLGGNLQVDGMKAGVTQVDTAYQAQFIADQATQQFGKAFSELSAKQQESLVQQAKSTQEVAREVDLNGLNEMIKASVASGEMTADQAVVFGQAVMQNVDALNALKNGASIAEAQFIMFSESIPGLSEAQNAQYKDLGALFSKLGGDLGQFENYMASVPEKLRGQAMAGLEGAAATGNRAMSASERLRRMTDYQTGFQSLSQSVGAEQAVAVQRGAAYQTALGTEGGTQKIDQAFAKAKEAGVTENVISYAIETKGASSPEDLVAKVNELTTATTDIMKLPENVIKGLEIDVNVPEDLEKYGPMVEALNKNWEIIQSLDPNIDMVASMKFLTLDGEGNPLDPQVTANRVAMLNKAFKNLGSGKASVRKQAQIDIATAYAGNEQVGDKSPAELAQIAIDELRKKFKDFDKLDPITQEQLIQTEMNYQVLNADLAAQNAELQQKITDELAKDKPDVMAISGWANQISANNKKMASAKKQAQAQQTAQKSAGGERGGGGGGGGGGEKPIGKQLQEEAKLLEDFAKQFSGERGKKIIAGPFGAEFLQYLQGQGEKGLKILKGNITNLNKAYDDFKKARRAEQAIGFSMLPAENIELQKQLAQRKQLNSAVENYAKNQGISLEMSRQAFDGLSEENRNEYLRLTNKKKLNDAEKERLRYLREQLGIQTSMAQVDLGQQQKDYVGGIKEEFDLNNKLKALGYHDEELEILKQYPGIMQMTDDQIRAAAATLAQFRDTSVSVEDSLRAQLDLSAANQRVLDIRRQLAEIDTLEPLQNELKTLQATNDTYSRRIEMRQRDLEPIDKAIEKLEEEKNKINEVYDARIKALEEVEKINQRLADQQQSQLDIASALSRGDMAAAAKATMDYQRQQAANRIEDTRGSIEAARQAELSAKDSEINALKDQRKIIEADIANIQLLQRNTQDSIYNKQIEINNETARLDGIYNNAAQRVIDLKNQLTLALAEQKKLADEAARMGTASATATPSATPAGGAAGGSTATPMVLPGFGIVATPKPISTAQAYAMGAVGGGGGTKKKKFFGGMINFKGSTEKAPGFMYGGKMKKFAMGSFVPGIGMTDKVPALLTPGEFVVRKSVAAQYGGLLSALNSNAFPSMQMFAGPSTPKTSTNTKDGIQYNYEVNVNLNGADMNPDDVAKAVMYQIKRSEDRLVRGTAIG